MLEFDTPLRAQVRALKSPNSGDFDAAAWRALLEAQDLTTSDLALGTMAMWVATQSESFRDHVGKRPPSQISARVSTVLAVAVLNHEHAVLSDKLLKAQKAATEAGTMSMDQLANLPIASCDGLFEVDAGSHMDAATDAVDSWIYEAADLPNEGNVPPELGSVAAQHMTRFSIQRGHYDLWQQALWEDWRLTSQDNRLVFAPADPDLAALQDAWLLRKQSNFMELVWLDMSTWPLMSQEARRARQLPRTVIRVDARKGMRRNIVVARPSVKHMSAYAMACSGLEGSYLASFLVRPLPKYPDFTCGVLLRTWHVLNDLARSLAAARPRATFNDMENVHQWALVVRHSELVNALCRALSLTEEFALRIVKFLSWTRGTYKGLWGAPSCHCKPDHGF